MTIRWVCFVTGHGWRFESERGEWFVWPDRTDAPVLQWQRSLGVERCDQCDKKRGWMSYGPTAQEADIAVLQHMAGLPVPLHMQQVVDAYMAARAEYARISAV